MKRQSSIESSIPIIKGKRKVQADFHLFPLYILSKQMRVLKEDKELSRSQQLSLLNKPSNSSKRRNEQKRNESTDEEFNRTFEYFGVKNTQKKSNGEANTLQTPSKETNAPFKPKNGPSLFRESGQNDQDVFKLTKSQSSFRIGITKKLGMASSDSTRNLLQDSSLDFIIGNLCSETTLKSQAKKNWSLRKTNQNDSRGHFTTSQPKNQPSTMEKPLKRKMMDKSIGTKGENNIENYYSMEKTHPKGPKKDQEGSLNTVEISQSNKEAKSQKEGSKEGETDKRLELKKIQRGFSDKDLSQNSKGYVADFMGDKEKDEEEQMNEKPAMIISRNGREPRESSHWMKHFKKNDANSLEKRREADFFKCRTGREKVLLMKFDQEVLKGISPERVKSPKEAFLERVYFDTRRNVREQLKDLAKNRKIIEESEKEIAKQEKKYDKELNKIAKSIQTGKPIDDSDEE